MVACAVAALAIVPIPADAQTVDLAKGGAASILHCMSVVRDSARLACFDSEAKALSTGIDSGKMGVVDEAAAAKAVRAQFGLNSAPEATIAKAAGVTKAAPIDSIESTVKQVFNESFGAYRIVLEDGSVWRTTEPASGRDPEPGDRIVVKRSAMGSFLANISGLRTVRIKRLN